MKTDLCDQDGATNQLTLRILAFISFSKGFFMINLVQIRRFIMKTQKGYFDFMLFWMLCVLSRVDETVSGEAPQRNYHTWGAAGVWTRTRNTDGSVRAYGNPLTLPFTDCGPRDIAVHKGPNHGQETVLNSVTLMLGLMWVSSRSPVCPNSSYRTLY